MNLQYLQYRITRHSIVLCALVALAGCVSLPTATPSADSAPTSTATVPDTPAPTPAARFISDPISELYTGELAPLDAGTELASTRVASLSAPDDLWDRIRRGFAMPDLRTPHVQEREQWYARRPEYFARMTQRSRKYIFHIVEELERRGMPTELALLPYIESAFNPVAVSSAKAAGIWQFMPATGNYFDLKQNAFRDDRRDVLASTRAALDYLQRLHRMFGDWHLALAAYNWGEGNVLKAIRRNQKNGKGTAYTDLKMPNETRLYVPKLQAMKNIIARPEAFNAELPDIPNHPYFQVVELDRDIDTALAARLADVRLEDFHTLNPSLNKPVILAAGTPRILLPWDNAHIFVRNLQAYDQGQFASWTVWIAPHTMSVAEAAQRTGMPETELRRANNIPPRMRIKAGAALMVPRTDKHTQDVSEKIADHAYLLVTPESVPGMRRTTVRAKAGDTVSTLARRHKISATNLARWNSLTPSSKLRTGATLQVYTPVRVSKPGASANKSASSAKPKTPAAKKTAVKNTPSKKPTNKTKTPAKKASTSPKN